MKINESSIDRVIRILTGFFLLYLGFGGSREGTVAGTAVLLGAAVLLTGVSRFCSIHSIFKFNDRKR